MQAGAFSAVRKVLLLGKDGGPTSCNATIRVMQRGEDLLRAGSRRSPTVVVRHQQLEVLRRWEFGGADKAAIDLIVPVFQVTQYFADKVPCEARGVGRWRCSCRAMTIRP